MEGKYLFTSMLALTLGTLNVGAFKIEARFVRKLLHK